MTTSPLSITKYDRLIFSGMLVSGMTLCTKGIAKAPTYGWTHPVSILGTLLGGLALLLGVQVIFRARIFPLRSDRQAIYLLAGIAATKFLLAFLYR